MFFQRLQLQSPQTEILVLESVIFILKGQTIGEDKKGLKDVITADLQQWNITTADGQVLALTLSGTVSYLALSLLALQVVVVSKGLWEQD